MLKPICTVLLLSAWSTSLASAQAPATFKHPGILTTATRLDNMRAQANASTPSARKTGYEAVVDDPRSSFSYAHNALATVQVAGSGSTPQELRWKDDMQAAYLNTLRWVKTGDPQHKNKALAILNEWSQTFTGFTLAPGTSSDQPDLEAAWVLPMVAQTGEILRHYGTSGWSSGDIATFNGYLEKLYSRASLASARTNNWGVSSGLSMMAIGVFQENRERYNRGYNTIVRLLPSIIASDGEVDELASRDCWHPQYSLTGFVQAAEIAGLQGDSSLWLYKAGGDVQPRLAKGVEYMAKSVNSGFGVRNCSNDYLRPGYPEIAVNGYMNRNVSVPTLQIETKASRPTRGSNQFLGWDTATHARDDY
jgi:hypothetical protein